MWATCSLTHSLQIFAWGHKSKVGNSYFTGNTCNTEIIMSLETRLIDVLVWSLSKDTLLFLSTICAQTLQEKPVISLLAHKNFFFVITSCFYCSSILLSQRNICVSYNWIAEEEYYLKYYPTATFLLFQRNLTKIFNDLETQITAILFACENNLIPLFLAYDN